MQVLKTFLKDHAEVLMTWVVGLFLVLQVLNLHSYVVQAVDHHAMVAINDDDAAWNLAKTVKTRWWKDNGWALYGPGCFRLNHTIHYFWQRFAERRPGLAHENWEMTAHHAIL